MDDMVFGGLSMRMHYKAFTLNMMGGGRIGGVPTGNYETLFNDARARTSDRRAFADLGYQKDLSPKLNLSLDSYTYKADYPYDSITDIGLNSEGAEGICSTLEARLRYDVRANNRFRLNLRMRRLLTISLLILGCCLHVQGQTEAVPVDL